MPRFSRESIKTHFFHVITQGINKSYIFNNEKEIKYYIKIMYELKVDYNLKIIAYCIMNNHAHMLIKVDTVANLSKYMHRLNTKYGIFYNKLHDRIGYVFRDRFKSEGIYDEKHYYSCIKYIYDNPVKAGICKHPKDYPYSNYKSIPVQLENDCFFIDIEDDLERNYLTEIEHFLKVKNLKIENLTKNKSDLESLIKLLKDKHNLSLRKISEILKIGREQIRILYNK